MVSISIHPRAIKTPAVKLYRPLIYRRSVNLYRPLHVSHLVSSRLYVDGEGPGVRPLCQVGTDPLPGPRNNNILTGYGACQVVIKRCRDVITSHCYYFLVD
jgi:hypothetical protein